MAPVREFQFHSHEPHNLREWHSRRGDGVARLKAHRPLPEGEVFFRLSSSRRKTIRISGIVSPGHGSCQQIRKVWMSVDSNPSEAEQGRRTATGMAMAEGMLRGLSLRYQQLPVPPVRQLRLTQQRHDVTRLPAPAVPRMLVSSRVAAALLRLESGKTDQPAVSSSRPPVDTDGVIGTLVLADGNVPVEPDLDSSRAIETEVDAASTGVPPAGSLTATDRRAFPRRESHCQVIVSRPRIDGPEGSARAAWQRESELRKGELLDISLSGAAFSLKEQPANGERLGLRLKKSHSHIVFDTRATVVRTARDEAAGCWQVFCQFERTLPFEQVVHFGYSLNRSSVV